MVGISFFFECEQLEVFKRGYVQLASDTDGLSAPESDVSDVTGVNGGRGEDVSLVNQHCVGQSRLLVGRDQANFKEIYKVDIIICAKTYSLVQLSSLTLEFPLAAAGIV